MKTKKRAPEDILKRAQEIEADMRRQEKDIRVSLRNITANAWTMDT